MANRRTALKDHPVVAPEQWHIARRELLKREKEFPRQRDELSRARRELPWERIEKRYVFQGPTGEETLADLFEGRSQLIVYHFMFGPEDDAGCKHCSFWADHFNPTGVHLNHRDATFVAISRAPWPKLDGFQRRMGWSAWRWGLRLGRDWVVSCVGFITVLLAAGMMSLRVDLLVAAAITAERLLPNPAPAIRAAGALAVMMGIVELGRVLILS